jgi:hypothetical protein
MKNRWMLVALISLAPALGAAAEAPRDAGREQAPRLLAEALERGTADVETIATIVRWVLEEKEEKVAPALASALRAAMDDDGGALSADPRWEAAARSALTLFEGLLDDARTHRRRDAASLSRDLAPLVEAAAPAVAEALRELDAPTQEALRQVWERLAPNLPCAPPR